MRLGEFGENLQFCPCRYSSLTTASVDPRLASDSLSLATTSKFSRLASDAMLLATASRSLA